LLVLKAIPQEELGLLLLKPGTKLLKQFTKQLAGNRVLVMPLPDSLVTVNSGALKLASEPITPQSQLCEESRLLEFFAHEEVQKRLGDDFKKWVECIPHCQAYDGDYCDKNLTVAKRGLGLIRLCWHHDNECCESVEQVGHANKNLMHWAIHRIEGLLQEGQPLTVSSLCWWAVRHGLYQYLPESFLYDVLNREDARRWVGNGYKSTGVAYSESPAQEMERLAKPVKTFTIDAEPPAMFMARPKPSTWKCESYLKFIRSLPCVVTGSKGTDLDPVVAHHLIGHGEGKMGGKAHDIFTFPILASEHTKLHHRVKAWEDRHGDQLLYIKSTIKKAFELGALC